MILKIIWMIMLIILKMIMMIMLIILKMIMMIMLMDKMMATSPLQGVMGLQ